MKFTFKENKSTGRYRSFYPSTHDIKLNKKVVGHITQINDGSGFIDVPTENIGKYNVAFAVKREKTAGNPAPFKWVNIKVKFDSVDEAKAWANRNIDVILAKFDIHAFECF